MALLLAVTLLIAGLAVITASVVPHFIDEASLSARDQLVREQVNNNLFYQAKIMELEAAKKESENRFQAPAVGEFIFVKNQKPKSAGIDHSPDANEFNAANDIRRYPKELRAYTAKNEIMGQVADENKMNEYSEAYREEFVRQFLLNARRNGYEVILGPDYKVLTVRQIRKSQVQLLTKSFT